jgi:hypothetical protein
METRNSGKNSQIFHCKKFLANRTVGVFCNPMSQTIKETERERVSRLADATGLSFVQVRALLRDRRKPHNKIIRAAWNAAMATGK